MERRDSNVANCLHVWHVALCVVWRRSEARTSDAKSVSCAGSLFAALRTGYVMSTRCVMFSFSRTAWHDVQTMMFFASIPSSCVMGAGAGERRW